MREELYFNDELRKCLNAAGLSDCGENDTWNYWYQRVHKAHNQAVDRVTEAQRAENAKLRELCATVIDDWMSKVCPSFPFCEFGGEYQDCTDETCGNQIYREMARELGVDE